MRMASAELKRVPGGRNSSTGVVCAQPATKSDAVSTAQLNSMVTRILWSSPNVKVSDGSQPPMTFHLFLSESAGSRSLHRLVEPSRCAAGLAASLTLATCSSIPQPMSRNRTGFCSRSTNHWQYRLESAKSNPHFLPGV
jgi:hypothetical protein